MNEKTAHARPPILSPGVFEVVAQAAEVRSEEKVLCQRLLCGSASYRKTRIFQAI